MLAIRMQRVGRTGHPEFRVVVQDSRLSPTSGRIVARLGHVNPHTKAITIDKEKTEQYLNNGAQPSPRVVRMLVLEKIKLPTWVVKSDNKKKRTIKNTDKLRRNRPAEEPKAEEPQVVASEVESNEKVVQETNVEESKVESPVSEVADTEETTTIEETTSEVEAEEPVAKAEPETAEPESTES